MIAFKEAQGEMKPGFDFESVNRSEYTLTATATVNRTTELLGVWVEDTLGLRAMPEEAKTRVNVALAGNRKLYLLACVFYGLGAMSAISRFGLSALPSITRWGHWMEWVGIGVEAWCIYFLVETFSSMSNRVEEVICTLTIIWFALGIPRSLHRLGYSWAHVPYDKWIDLVVITVAAFLVFLRTFQVFHRHNDMGQQITP